MWSGRCRVVRSHRPRCNWLLLSAAGIDLSSGSVVGLSAVRCRSLSQLPDYPAAFYKGLQVPLFVAILAACGAGALVGLINGSLVAKTTDPAVHRHPGDFNGDPWRSLLYTGGSPISDLTDGYNFIGQGDLFGVPVPILLLVLMALVTHVLYSQTKFGKYVYAIGGNEQAARVSGINVGSYKMLMYVYAGVFGGISLPGSIKLVSAPANPG